MRWRKKEYSGPYFGDTKKADGFLLFPKCINGDWRWFERARWVEMYCLIWSNDDRRFYGWRATEWLP